MEQQKSENNTETQHFSKELSFVDYLAIFSLGFLLFSSFYAIIYFNITYDTETFWSPSEFWLWMGLCISMIFRDQIMTSIVFFALALICLLVAIYLHKRKNEPFNKVIKACCIVIWSIFLFFSQW